MPADKQAPAPDPEVPCPKCGFAACLCLDTLDPPISRVVPASGPEEEEREDAINWLNAHIRYLTDNEHDEAARDEREYARTALAALSRPAVPASGERVARVHEDASMNRAEDRVTIICPSVADAKRLFDELSHVALASPAAAPRNEDVAELVEAMTEAAGDKGRVPVTVEAFPEQFAAMLAHLRTLGHQPAHEPSVGASDCIDEMARDFWNAVPISMGDRAFSALAPDEKACLKRLLLIVRAHPPAPAGTPPTCSRCGGHGVIVCTDAVGTLPYNAWREPCPECVVDGRIASPAGTPPFDRRGTFEQHPDPCPSCGKYTMGVRADDLLQCSFCRSVFFRAHQPGSSPVGTPREPVMRQYRSRLNDGPWNEWTELTPKRAEMIADLPLDHGLAFEHRDLCVALSAVPDAGEVSEAMVQAFADAPLCEVGNAIIEHDAETCHECIRLGLTAALRAAERTP